MKNKLVFLNIFSPSIICFTIIIIGEIGIDYYPLSFGLVIGIANWKQCKYAPYLGVIISLLVSYLAFFIGFFTFPLLSEIFKPLFGQDNGAVNALAVSSFIIAPLFVFYLYKFVFDYPKTKITNYIVIISILILIIVFYFNDYPFFNFLENIRLDHYAIWQIIMALAIQLIINQDIFKKKKG